MENSIGLSIRAIVFAASVGGVVATSILTPLKFGHVLVSAIPLLILMVIAATRAETKSLLQFRGTVLSAFWAGAGATNAGMNNVSMVTYTLSFGILGFLAGEFAENLRSQK